MAGRLEGKHILVTAAAAGIGRASALAFAAEGARVLATDLDVAGLEALPRSGALAVARLDMRDSDAVADLVARAGPFDGLFNAAGFVHHGDVMACSEEDWDFSFDLNVKSMYRAIRAVVPGMLAKGAGSIINMASVASSVKGAPNRFVYGATKGAVIGLTKAIAADYAARGVRCNAIAPGTVDTPSLAVRMSSQGDYETARAAFIARQPMGRLGTAEEIAALAVYLASDESAFTTGAVHVIDGGWSG
jgi:2-keto-3-deoxy-L-fuconate dehydrogenase